MANHVEYHTHILPRAFVFRHSPPTDKNRVNLVLDNGKSGMDKMKTFTLSTEQLIEKPRDEVFSYFSDAHNLAEITPPWLKFVVLTPRPIEMAVGTLIDYRLKLRGIPVRWQSEITEWNPPHFFADEQRRGPYRCWIHKHTFVETEGGTLVGDEVHYAVLGGQLINKLFVRPDIEKIFAYRSQKLQELLNT